MIQVWARGSTFRVEKTHTGLCQRARPKGTIPTKCGTKDQYLNAVAADHRAGIQNYADVVFNHKMGADFTQKVK
jgi:hypothetical protein